MKRAARFLAKVSVFNAVRIHEVLPLIGDEDLELVHRKRGWSEEGAEVNVRRGRAFWLSTVFGALATQFD